MLRGAGLGVGCGTSDAVSVTDGVPVADGLTGAGTSPTSSEPEHPESAQRLRMMEMVVRHLALFVGGTLEGEGLGDFCCASRPVRQNDANIAKESPPA